MTDRKKRGGQRVVKKIQFDLNRRQRMRRGKTGTLFRGTQKKERGGRFRPGSAKRTDLGRGNWKA